MGSLNKQTFLQGAIILMAANILTRVISAIFRIPIYNEIGGAAWSYYQTAYSLYVYFFAISTMGLPVAISRMVAVASMEQNREEERRIFRMSLLMFVVVGVAGTGVMLAIARTFVTAVANPDAYYSILVLAPTLFFVCLTSAFRGYFQGKQNMFPTAITEVIGALGKLFVGYGAALYALNRGYEMHIVAAFAVSGLTAGVAVGFIFLTVTKLASGRAERQKPVKLNVNVRGNGEIAREIIKIALPITLSASLISLSGLIDTLLMQRRLIDAGYTAAAARAAFGDYSAQALTLFNFPNVLIIPFAVSIIPVLSQHFANNNAKAIKSTVESTFRVVTIISMPCAFGIAAMSRPILHLLFTDSAAVEATAPLLSVLAFAVVFVAMAAVTNAMLQSQGQERRIVISTGVGILVKLAAAYVLIGTPAVGRIGTPIATVLCYFAITAMNFYFLVRYTGIVPPIRRTFIKPFMASAVMAACAILIYMLLAGLLGATAATLAAIAAAAGIYLVLTLAFKTLKREDVLLLPRGAKLYAAMKKRNLIDD